MSLAVGDTVAGRYDVRERLGSGGFSTVWLATDRRTDRTVALKCAAVGTHDRDEVGSRFDRETAALERFRDGIAPSGIVRFFEADADHDPRYIALEYLPGDTLADRLGTGTLGSSVRRRVAFDLAETLDFLHRNGVVYLDLKPENVVLRASGRPVLLDFNTAVTLPDPVVTRFASDQYKAPELLPDTGETGAAGPRSDVYAWGKLAFYLLTGAKVLTENVPEDGLDPREFGSSCGASLAAVVERATILDPTDRYADGLALRDALATETGRGPRALLTHVASDVTCSVSDGHTMGRLGGGTPVPWAVLPDPDAHISPRHARFERSPEGWVLVDTSLNGTYVGTPGDWTYVLSEAGYERRVSGGDPPPSRVALTSGTLVAPVHPQYGLDLRVTMPGESTVDPAGDAR